MREAANHHERGTKEDVDKLKEVEQRRGVRATQKGPRRGQKTESVVNTERRKYRQSDRRKERKAGVLVSVVASVRLPWA